MIVLEPATGHICNNHLTKVPAEGASCTDHGNIEYYTCSCGKWYSDATASVEITDKNSVKIDAGHNYGTLISAQPEIHTATQLKAGVDAHYFCDKCDTYFTEGKIATTLADLTGATPSHNYATQYGYKEADGHADTCSCGANNTVVGHTPDRAEATENDSIKCSACGYVITPALGHIHQNNLTKVPAETADCEKDGNIEYYTCSCGKWFSDSTASVEITDKESVKIAGGHNYGTLVNKVPAIHTATELKAGKEAHYFCDKCNTYFTEGKVATTEETLVIAAPTHDYSTQHGYKEADGHADTCSCGTHNTIVTHTPDRDAATETDAVKCSACGYVITPALGHIHKNNLTKVGAQSADCENDGNIEYYTCSCGKWFEDASASAEITDKDSVKVKGGHNYGTEWKSDKDSCWNECVCGDKANITTHADENKDGKCDVCAYAVDKPSDSPQTGDNSNMVLWISLLMLSALGVVATTIIGKKRYPVK